MKFCLYSFLCVCFLGYATKWQQERAYKMTFPLHIRQKCRSVANARERKCMTSLNEAFENHCRDRPLSKMEALQLVQNYIKELMASLQNDTDLLQHQQINEDYSSVYY